MSASPTAEDEIRRLLEQQIVAWNAGDAAAWCKDYVTDAAFVNILGMRFESRESNQRRHAELFDGIFKGSRIEQRDMQIRILDDATAIADVTLDLTGFHELPPGIRPSIGEDVLRTLMHFVLVREGARWWIVFSQNTAVMPGKGDGGN